MMSESQIERFVEREISQIERFVEREMDKLDKLFLNGAMSIEQYDKEVASLDRWANRQYDALISIKSIRQMNYI